MQYQHTKRELEMAELIEGSERDRRRLAELLDGIRVGPGVDAMADGMREAVWADVRSRIRRRGIRMRIVRYAAAAAVMAGVVCGSWFMGGRRTESRLVAAAQPVSVSTPLGVKSDVVLPDGSRVRLNGGTRIVYPALFGDERRVEVDGEAYFEVEHDARRPFVVVTGQVVSTVLGTTFNVHAYSEDENYQITLATGSLLVDGGPESRSVRLRPGEQGFFERTSGLLSLRRVNVEQVLSWQEDRLYFRAEPLASIARSLERQFNVDITIPDERLRRICFTGESSSTARTSTKSCGSSRPTAVSSAAAARTISSFTETDRDSRFFSLQPKFQSL